MPIIGIVAVVLAAHGIGHVLGVMPVLGMTTSTPGWTADSALLNGVIGEAPVHVLGLVVWLVATVGFLVAAAGLLGYGVSPEVTRTVAIVASIASLLGLLLFWDAFPTLTTKVGAIAVDLAVLYAVFVAHWPAIEIGGA